MIAAFLRAVQAIVVWALVVAAVLYGLILVLVVAVVVAVVWLVARAWDTARGVPRRP